MSDSMRKVILQEFVTLDGLAAGLQIMAKTSSDLDVLALGRQCEAAAGWFRRHPTA